MRRNSLEHVARVATMTSLTIALAGSPAVADQSVSLAHLAPQLGYTYTWIGAESAVALTRPGLYVLVRTGNPLYDVNDSVESTAVPPEYRNNEVFIGSALVARLRALATKYASSRNGASGVAGPLMVAQAQGSLAISARPTNISDAVIVSGSGPANVPITITLSADIERDIPRVTLSRTTIDTDPDGKFVVQISTAPLHLQKSIVLISATSLPGVTEAHTSFILGQPNPTIAHPVDELPRDFRPH